MVNIQKITREASEICVPCCDVMRYSGCRNSTDEKLINLADECLAELKEKITLCAVYSETDITFECDTADFGFIQTESNSLRTFLGGSSKAYIFAATLGIGADMLINRYSTLSPAKAVIMDGCATAAIECWCDYLCKEVFKVPACERFSAGYGDLPLAIQPHLLSHLQASVNIGLSMTDSFLLTPTKSVTAIVKKKD